jgi:hypothetical protein
MNYGEKIKNVSLHENVCMLRNHLADVIRENTFLFGNRLSYLVVAHEVDVLKMFPNNRQSKNFSCFVITFMTDNFFFWLNIPENHHEPHSAFSLHVV